MKAVILAAGEGKRLRPFTESMPKVMLPVGNKPILEHIVDALRKSGVQKIVMVVGYKKEVILEYFKDFKDIDFVHQDKQLGTAHALFKAKDEIKNEQFLILSGDNIVDGKSILSLINEKSDYSMLIKEQKNQSKYGVVFLKDGYLEKIVKQPEEDIGRYISTGVYKFPRSIFEKVEEFCNKGDYSFFSVIESIVKSGKKIKTIKSGLWMDVVYPWDLIDVNSAVLRDISGSTAGKIEKNVVLKGSVDIGENTRIYSGTYIIGPVKIGSNCEIGPNTCIFPSTSIGDNSIVSPFCEIRNSVLMDEIFVGSNSSISNSVISKGCNIENNFSSLTGKASLEIEDEYKKLGNIGVMIGEDSNIGSHVVTDPGIVIGRRCSIASLKNINKNVSSNVEVM